MTTALLLSLTIASQWLSYLRLRRIRCTRSTRCARGALTWFDERRHAHDSRGLLRASAGSARSAWLLVSLPLLLALVAVWLSRAVRCLDRYPKAA